MSGSIVADLIEQLSSILWGYVNSDLDSFSYDQISSDIQYFEGIVNSWTTVEGTDVVVGPLSQAIPYLYIARNNATPDVSRDYVYYQSMQSARNYFLIILGLSAEDL